MKASIRTPHLPRGAQENKDNNLVMIPGLLIDTSNQRIPNMKQSAGHSTMAFVIIKPNE